MPVTPIAPPPALPSLAIPLAMYGGAWAIGEAVTPLVLAAALAMGAATWRLLRTLAVPRAASWAMLATALTAPMTIAGLTTLWTAAALLAIDAALMRRHGMMLAWCGIAIGLGMPAGLLAPFLAAVVVSRRVRPASWLLAPLGYAAARLIGASAALPAAIAPAPNLWFAATALLPDAAAQIAGLAIVGVIGASACYVARFSVQMPTAAARALPVALLAVLMTAGLSPRGDAADIALAGGIALVWAIAARERRAWQVAGLIHLGLALAVGGGRLGLAGSSLAGFGAIALATWLLLRPAVKPAANDNPVMMRRFRHAPLATYLLG